MENINLENLKSQKVAVLGLGKENLSLTQFLVRHDIKPTICDQRSEGELGEYFKKVKDLPVEFRLGSRYLENLGDFEVIFRTPGLPYLHEKIQKAKAAGVEISSQIKLFFNLCPCPIIGVTGTKGKGTTTTLIGEILKKTSLGTFTRPNIKGKIFLGGNIGTPPIEFLEQLKPEDMVILELSSFQLQDMEKSPHIAVILDIKTDHLDYHKNREEYIESKQNIVKFQNKSDFAVINADYLTSFEFGALTPAELYWFSRRKSVDQGSYVRGNQEFVLRIDDKELPICKTNEIILRGEHNFENICAAVTASYLSGADVTSIKKVVTSFKGLEHRLEFVRNFKGINFYNDSYSTTPDTTIAAIKSFTEPMIILVGGSEKNADYKELSQVITKSSVKALIGIGSTAKKIIEASQDNPSIKKINDTQSMDEAVKMTLSLVETGDVVVLSPASASFDRYKNYHKRGEIFKKAVLNLHE